MDFTYSFRPKNFDEIIGQEHLCSSDAPFRILSQNGELGHSFLYGPAGVGKTSLARVVASVMQLPFYEFNATSLKIEQLRKVFQKYENTLQKALVFIDEVHRLSKNQQEVLLPVMENNNVLVMGASTENPFYSLTSAIRSRSMLFELKPLSSEALEKLLKRVIKDTDADINIDSDAFEYLIYSSASDARAMLKLLEFALKVQKHLTLPLLKSIRPNALSLGSSEDGIHYGLTSALIKSIRGSDVDAAIYYLAKLIDGGESAEFIARRLVILASEDIGNANPQALTLTTSTMTSVGKIGYPEARIILAQAVIYLCASPKSNSAYMAINTALDAIKNGLNLNIVPNILPKSRDYLYPHDFGGYVQQSYLEKDIKFVELKDIGYEKKMKEWLEFIKR